MVDGVCCFPVECISSLLTQCPGHQYSEIVSAARKSWSRETIALHFSEIILKETRQAVETAEMVGGSEVKFAEYCLTCKYLCGAFFFYHKSTNYF